MHIDLSGIVEVKTAALHEGCTYDFGIDSRTGEIFTEFALLKSLESHIPYDPSNLFICYDATTGTEPKEIYQWRIGNKLGFDWLPYITSSEQTKEEFGASLPVTSGDSFNLFVDDNIV